MVDDSKTSDERKLHLTMKIYLMLSKDSNEKLMYSKSNKKGKPWLVTIQMKLLNKFFSHGYLIYRNFLVWKFVKRYSFRRILGDSPKTKQKLCLSTKFAHQKIRSNFCISRSHVDNCTQLSYDISYMSNSWWIIHIFPQGWIQKFWKWVALHVGHYGWPTKKILGLRWSKNAKAMLEAISFWPNISFSIF